MPVPIPPATLYYVKECKVHNQLCNITYIVMEHWKYDYLDHNQTFLNELISGLKTAISNWYVVKHINQTKKSFS